MSTHLWAAIQGTLSVEYAMGGYVIERSHNNTLTYFPATGNNWVPLYDTSTHGCLARRFSSRDEAQDFMFEQLLMSRYKSCQEYPDLTRFWQHQATLQVGVAV
jgi:hypothetical protein